jgi:hypothetical protein
MLSKENTNWFGLVCGIAMLLDVCLSTFTPWWQLQIGKNPVLITINANPFNTNFGVLSANFIIPILFAINIGITVLFAISGVLLIVYSLNPKISYAKELLCYGYKRPIYTVVGFVVSLLLFAYVIPSIVNSAGANVSAPLFQLIGTSIIQLPTSMFGVSMRIGVTVSAAFQYTFYLAVAATALAIVARLYHRKLSKVAPTEPQQVASVTPA